MPQPLTKKPLLQCLSPGDASTLLALADHLSFAPDQVILGTAEKSRHFYVLLNGSVVVELARPTFRLGVQTLGPGDAFGWSALLQGSETLFQVRAREACCVACIPGTELTALCHSDSAFGVRLLVSILGIVSQRVHGAEARLLEFCAVEPAAAFEAVGVV